MNNETDKTLSKEMSDELKDFYVLLKQVSKLEDIIPEFELWLNSNYDFLILWEQIFGDVDFEFEKNDEDDFIKFEDWANSESISLIKHEAEYYIHPHILLAFSMEDPMIKINLLSAIFSLPDDMIDGFLLQTFGQDEDDEDKCDDCEGCDDCGEKEGLGKEIKKD